VSETLLDAEALNAFYGPIQALHGVSLTLTRGGITALLGANGAGKTTLLRAICRSVRTTGVLRFDGRSIAHHHTAAVARMGIAHVPEGRGTFTRLSVEENLRLGAFARRDRAQVARDREQVEGFFPILRERLQQPAGALSGGEQQMLAIARALMLRPRLLLLDEPSFGLGPRIVSTLFDILRAVTREQQVGMLIVEQNAALALELADEACLLEAGRVVMRGAAAELRADPGVRRAYLGY